MRSRFCNKFLIIRADDVILKLDGDETTALRKIIKKIGNKNRYYVVNLDEPYAPAVRELIKAFSFKRD